MLLEKGHISMTFAAFSFPLWHEVRLRVARFGKGRGDTGR